MGLVDDVLVVKEVAAVIFFFSIGCFVVKGWMVDCDEMTVNRLWVSWLG